MNDHLIVVYVLIKSQCRTIPSQVPPGFLTISNSFHKGSKPNHVPPRILIA